MLKSVQCAPLCARAARLQCPPALRHSTEAGSGRATWLESLFTWLQKAGRACPETCPGKKREGLLSILADHCSFVTGQRLRRALQIAELYSNLYSERSRWTLVGSIWRRLQNKQAPTGKLLAALAGVFMWEDEKIRDDEMKRFVLKPYKFLQLGAGLLTCSYQWFAFYYVFLFLSPCFFMFIAFFQRLSCLCLFTSFFKPFLL